MESFSRNLNIGFSATRKMLDEVFRISKGNPCVISTIFEKARRPEYLKDDRLNIGLIMIDSKVAKLYSEI